MAKKRRAKKVTVKRPRTLAHRMVLTVDPGTNYGAALFFDGKLIGYWDGLQTLGTVAGIISFVSVKSKLSDCTAVVAVENQYVARGKAANPKTTASILRRRHFWEIVAEVRGIEVGDSFYPASWQTILTESPCVGGDTKAKSLALARARWGAPFTDKPDREDLADAACMGLWYHRTQLMEHPKMQVAAWSN